MIITHTLQMELSRTRPLEPLYVMQDDKYSRDVCILLTLDDDPWPIPEGTAAVIHFEKADGTGGNYDALPDGTAACSFSGNALKLCLAPQVCTVPGAVKLTVTLTLGEKVISTFAFYLSVQRAVGRETVSENYFKVAGALADSGWEPNMYLGTDENGKVVAKMGESDSVQTVNGIAPDENGNVQVEGGIGNTEKDLILALLRASVYTKDMRAAIADLTALWSVSYAVTYNISGVNADVTPGLVVANESYNCTLTAAGGHTLTGATVKITMGGVDITSAAYNNGVISIPVVTGDVVISVEAKQIPSYTITNDLTGVTTDNSATKVSEGGYYSATLTVDDGYVLSSLVITMGGVDVTADVYGEGQILIPEVTGDVVITAVAEQPVVIPTTAVGAADTFNAYSDGGSTSIGTVYYRVNTVNTNVIAAADSTVMVTIKNETEDAMDIGTLYFGSRSPAQTIKLGTCILHYAEAKTLSTLAAGESVTYEAQVKAGYLFAVGHQTTATITVTGNVVDAVPTVSEYAVNEAVLAATSNFHSDGTTDSKLNTQYNKKRKETAEAFAEDTNVIITIIGGGQLSFGYIGCVAANEAADMFYVNALSASNAGFNATLPYQITYTVRAGYYLAVPGNATNVYVQKA